MADLGTTSWEAPFGLIWLGSDDGQPPVCTPVHTYKQVCVHSNDTPNRAIRTLTRCTCRTSFEVIRSLSHTWSRFSSIFRCRFCTVFLGNEHETWTLPKAGSRNCKGVCANEGSNHSTLIKLAPSHTLTSPQLHPNYEVQFHLDLHTNKLPVPHFGGFPSPLINRATETLFFSLVASSIVYDLPSQPLISFLNRPSHVR